MEKKQKLKLSDIWYYYKGYVLIAVIVIVGIAYTVYTNINEVTTDILIDCASDKCFSAEQARILNDDLNNSGIVPDIDGDGKGIAQINAYQTGTSGDSKVDAQNTEVTQVKMSVGESAIIITDESVINMYAYYDMFKDITHLAQTFGAQDVIKDVNGKVIAINIDNCQWLARNGIKTDGLYLTLRIPSADLEDDKQLMKQFENAEQVAEYILK